MVELDICLPPRSSFAWPCLGYIFADPLRFIGGKVKDDLRWIPPGNKCLISLFVESFGGFGCVCLFSTCASCFQCYVLFRRDLLGSSGCFKSWQSLEV